MEDFKIDAISWQSHFINKSWKQKLNQFRLESKILNNELGDSGNV